MPPGGGIRTIKTSPEVIRLAVMLNIRFPLSPRNVEGPLRERATVTGWGADLYAALI